MKLKYNIALGMLTLCLGNAMIVADDVINLLPNDSLQNVVTNAENYAHRIRFHVTRFFDTNISYSYRLLISEFDADLIRFNHFFVLPLAIQVRSIDANDVRRIPFEDMHRIMNKLYTTMRTLLDILKKGNKVGIAGFLKLKQGELLGNMRDVSRQIDVLIGKLQANQEDPYLIARLQALKNELSAAMSSNTSATEILALLDTRLKCP